jgi:hypothetical protein
VGLLELVEVQESQNEWEVDGMPLIFPQQSSALHESEGRVVKGSPRLLKVAIFWRMALFLLSAQNGKIIKAVTPVIPGKDGFPSPVPRRPTSRLPTLPFGPSCTPIVPPTVSNTLFPTSNTILALASLPLPTSLANAFRLLHEVQRETMVTGMARVLKEKGALELANQL